MNRSRRWNAAADETRFRADVRTGDVAVQILAEHLRIIGLWDVQVPEVEVRDEFTQRRQFRDAGDLFLNGHRIEVRSFGFYFTSQADFPQRTVQVELASVAGFKANAVAYLFVSRQSRRVVGLFGPELRKLDRENGVWNERRQVARDWMVADARRLKDWDSLVCYLAERCAVPARAGE